MMRGTVENKYYNTIKQQAARTSEVHYIGLVVLQLKFGLFAVYGPPLRGKDHLPLPSFGRSVALKGPVGKVGAGCFC